MNRISSETVRQLARQAGFDLCGVASPDVIPEAAAKYRRWLEQRRHAGMGYMSNDPERRADPSHVLPSVRSIIVLGINYYQPNSPNTPPGHGRVARYARGRDYHKVIERMVENLLGRLPKFAGDSPRDEFRGYCDHGPVLERAYAVKAGLGSIGKNSMLINREFGSWIFLAEILTSLEIELATPDAELTQDRCGECTLCIDSCPTSAIQSDRTIDSNICLSYLTVERPADLTPALKSAMGRNLFGCDICQEVCPLNRQPITTRNRDLVPPKGVGEFIDARKVVAMQSRAEFLELTAGTSLTRPKLTGLKACAEAVLDNETKEE